MKSLSGGRSSHTWETLSWWSWTPRAIDAMLSELLRSGLSASTVRSAHTVLSSAYKEAVRLGVTDRNPAESVSPPVRRHRPVVPPPVAVVQDLLRLAREEGHHYLYPFLHLLTYTGMRRGEALALRGGRTSTSTTVI